MKLALAPMEGVCDVYLRQILTAMGGFDYCVTEFIRVSDHLLPDKTFYRECPELLNGAKTISGVPVHVQLLGSDSIALAENAARAVELGAPVIDLNFGCPSKRVNNHMGGSALLQYPDTLFNIVQAVRSAVPDSVPVSAKMRLGFYDKSLAVENAQALQAGGVSWLTVHGRTKLEGYRPPAHWQWIGKIREAVSVPVMANGEIWCADDAKACQSASGCRDMMLGRGALSRPDLALSIKDAAYQTKTWLEIKHQYAEYLSLIENTAKPCQVAGRLKQWLSFLSKAYLEAECLLQKIKTLKNPSEIAEHLILS